MLKYTVQSVLAMPFAKAKAEQAPFPGKFPTRVLLFLGEKVYLGKPPGMLFYMEDRFRGRGRVLEFDRKHVILDTYKDKPLECQSFLFRSYHPQGLMYPIGQDKQSRRMAGWFDRKQLVQRTLLNETQFVCYFQGAF